VSATIVPARRAGAPAVPDGTTFDSGPESLGRLEALSSSSMRKQAAPIDSQPANPRRA
jgi:hypothetical protein